MSPIRRAVGHRAPPPSWLLSVWLLLALIALPLRLFAQQEPPAVAAKDGEGNGFKVGGARIHPFGDLQLHYVYNPGRLADNPSRTGAEAVSDLMFAPRGGMELEYPGSFVDLRLSLEGLGRIYSGLENGLTGNLSNFSSDVKLDALFNREGTFTVRVTDQLKPITADFNNSNNQFLVHTSNDIGFVLDAKPGGGALVFSTSASFFVDYYHRTTAALNVDLQDNYRISPRFRAAWKFLPKTAVFLESDLMVTNYFSDANRSQDFDFIFKVQLGANGNITSKLSAVLKVGYGDTFSEVAAFRTVVGLAELGYTISETAKISLGYTRTIQPISIFEYAGTDNTYLRYAHLIAGFVQLQADIGFSYVQYGADPNQAQNATNGSISNPRQDLRLVANVGADFFILDDWLSVGVSERFEFNESNFTYPDVAGLPGPSADYLSNDLFVRVMAKY